ncbi:MAG TPA: TIM barrel protein [Hanamia sp.]
MKNSTITRRRFLQISGLGATAMMLPGMAWSENIRKLDIKTGATFILWGYGADALEPALKDISKLGFHGFETFGQVIEEWENNRGGFGEVVSKYGVPLISAFCSGDVINPAKREDELKNLVRWSKLVKKSGGKLIEYCAVGNPRQGYDYSEHKKDIIDSMNLYAKAITDEGLICALHPHTGTAIETTEEIYFAMENVNTTYMKFGPDVGQMEKAGVDPVKIVKDFLPLVEHVHLKDYEGGIDNGWLGYSPLGEGKVKLKKILKMLESRRNKMGGMIMFELDSDGRHTPPLTPLEAATVSRDLLVNLGYQFNGQT